MRNFNLLDEPWLPVCLLDGQRTTLSLLDVFRNLQNIRNIEDPSPTITGGIYRFLLAVLYRALQGPRDLETAKALFATGLPTPTILAYLESVRGRLWLIHPTHPFGQNPGTPHNKPEGANKLTTRPWTSLNPERNIDGSRVFNDHTDTRVGHLPMASFAEIARLILATSAFSIPGGSGYFTSLDVEGLRCLPLGDTLEATLLFNLVPYPTGYTPEADSALWERDPRVIPDTSDERREARERAITGLADLYTQQPRMVLVEPEGEAGVLRIRYASGDAASAVHTFHDPMCAYQSLSTKAMKQLSEGQQIRADVLPLHEDREPWTDTIHLLPMTTQAPPKKAGGTVISAPDVMHHALALTADQPERSPRAVLVLGLGFSKAKILSWRMRQIPLFPGALASKELPELLNWMSQGSSALEKAGFLYAKTYSLTDAPRKVLNAVATGLPALISYWALLREDFMDLMRSGDTTAPARVRWLQTVSKAKGDAWYQNLRDRAVSGRRLQAMIHAEGIVNRLHWAIAKEIKAATPQLPA